MCIAVLCVPRQFSLFRRPVKHTVYIDIIVRSLNAPISELQNLLVQKIIEKLHCSLHILTAYGDGNAIGGTQLRPTLYMPLIGDTPVNRDRQRHISAALLIQSFERTVDIISKLPPLVHHAEHPAAGKLSEIFLITLCKKFLIDNPLIVLLI